jgi:hypothetical protein
MKTALYRIWGNDGQLLYVGISKSALSRLGQHLTEKPWAEEISNVTIETFPTRELAAAAEVAAIKAERPLHNVVHNGHTHHNKNVKVKTNQRSSFVIQGPAEPVIAQKGDFVALGMSNGECPVGRVVLIEEFYDDTLILLELKSWVTGWYGHDSRCFWFSEIEHHRLIREDKGYVNDKSLGSFQNNWVTYKKLQSLGIDL